MPFCDARCLQGVPDSPCCWEHCLVEHGRRGSAEARERLFSLLAPCVLQRAQRLCGASGMAQDIAQAALVLVLEHLDDLRRPDRLGAWVKRIVINTCRMEERKRAARAQTEECSAGVMAPPDDSERLLDVRRQLSWIAQAAPALPPPLAETFRLRVVEGLSTRQTAELLGVSPEAVRARLSRARRWLRARGASAA